MRHQPMMVAGFEGQDLELPTEITACHRLDDSENDTDAELADDDCLLTTGPVQIQSPCPKEHMPECCECDGDSSRLSGTDSTVDSSMNLTLEEEFSRLQSEFQGLSAMAEKRLAQKVQSSELISNLKQEVRELRSRNAKFLQRRERLLDGVDIAALWRLEQQQEQQHLEQPRVTMQQLLLYRDLALYHVEMAQDELEKEREVALELLERQEAAIDATEGDVDHVMKLLDVQDSVKDLKREIQIVKEDIEKLQRQKEEQRHSLRQRVHSMRMGRPDTGRRTRSTKRGASEDDNANRLDCLRKEIHAQRERRTQSMTLAGMEIELSGRPLSRSHLGQWR